MKQKLMLTLGISAAIYLLLACSYRLTVVTAPRPYTAIRYVVGADRYSHVFVQDFAPWVLSVMQNTPSYVYEPIFSMWQFCYWHPIGIWEYRQAEQAIVQDPELFSRLQLLCQRFSLPEETRIAAHSGTVERVKITYPDTTVRFLKADRLLTEEELLETYRNR